MKRATRNSPTSSMGPDAYAGFLKLLLTPTTRAVELNRDVASYMEHASRIEPLSDATRRMAGLARERAA